MPYIKIPGISNDPNLDNDNLLKVQYNTYCLCLLIANNLFSLLRFIPIYKFDYQNIVGKMYNSTLN